MLNDDLAWLLNWFYEQCDEDWEHMFGIEIKTVTGGWNIMINIDETLYEKCHFNPIKIHNNEDDWYFCIKRNNNFEASCSPENLEDVLHCFREWAENCKQKNS